MVSQFTKRIYFQELSKKKILTKEQQLHYAQNIAKLKEKLNGTNQASKIKKIQEKIRLTRNLLVESCYFMVVKIAKKYHNRYLSLFDLIEEGNLVLVKAIDTFDYRRNIKFSTYVSILIKNHILTAITHRGKTIRPQHFEYGSRSFVSITSPGQAPFRTFTRQLEVDSFKMLRAIKNLQEVQLEYEKGISQESFDKSFFYNQSDKGLPEFNLFQKALVENIKNIKNILTPRENDIIIKYYGLDQVKAKNYNAIAKDLKLTSERVRQIHNQAIKKIKNSDLNSILKDFLADT